MKVNLDVEAEAKSWIGLEEGARGAGRDRQRSAAQRRPARTADRAGVQWAALPAWKRNVAASSKTNPIIRSRPTVRREPAFVFRLRRVGRGARIADRRGRQAISISPAAAASALRSVRTADEAVLGRWRSPGRRRRGLLGAAARPIPRPRRSVSASELKVRLRDGLCHAGPDVGQYQVADHHDRQRLICGGRAVHVRNEGVDRADRHAQSAWRRPDGIAPSWRRPSPSP